MKSYDPRSIRGIFRKYPILARFVCVANLLLYPVIIPVSIVIAGYKEIAPDIKGGATELLSAAFLPWKKTK